MKPPLFLIDLIKIRLLTQPVLCRCLLSLNQCLYSEDKDRYYYREVLSLDQGLKMSFLIRGGQQHQQLWGSKRST